MRDIFGPHFAAALFDQAVDAVLVTSPHDGKILAANAAAERILGRSRKELQDLERGGLIDSADSRWIDAMAVRAREGSFRGLLSALRADGSSIEVDLHSAVYESVNGQPRAYVIFRDVTDYLDQLAALTTVNDVAESMTDAFYALDAEQRITYMNHQAQQKIGVVFADVEGQVLWDVFPAVTAPLQGPVSTVLSTGEPSSVELYFPPTDLHAEVRLFSLRSGGVGVFFLDVGARKVAEAEREALLTAEQAARATAERARAEMRHRASHDDLTGLPNRAGLTDAFEAVMAAKRVENVCLLFAELDRFKRVSDSLGHVGADQVLASFAARLGAMTPPDALVARFGGDEFVLVLFDASVDEAEATAAAVIEASKQPFTVWSPSGEASTVFVAASVGLARSDGDSEFALLLRGADAALHKAKSSGRERFAWFDQSFVDQVVDRLALEGDLRSAITTQMVLHYQVAFDIDSGRPRHIEALARWYHPERGMVPPSLFIPLAEESGLDEELGRWVIAEGARQAASWDLEPGTRVFVNVSPVHLARPDFTSHLSQTLQATGCPSERFGIEVTEAALAEAAGMSAQINLVRELGVAVAIDDFGTGYSSLARLSHTPIDVIKIDRAFVAGAVEANGYALLEGIVSLAHALGATVVAEGVECTEELESVTRAGSDSTSGYLLGRPVSAAEVQLSPPSALVTGT